MLLLRPKKRYNIIALLLFVFAYSPFAFLQAEYGHNKFDEDYYEGKKRSSRYRYDHDQEDDYYHDQYDEDEYSEYDDEYDEPCRKRKRYSEKRNHPRKYAKRQKKSFKDKEEEAEEEEKQEPQDLISDLIEAIHESIASIINTAKAEIWGKGLLIRIGQFIESFIYAVISKVAFYVLTNPQWVWAYLGRLAGINNGIRNQLLTGDIWKRFAWKAFYGVLVSMSLSLVKTFVQKSLGQKKGQSTTLKKVIAVIARTLSIWIAIYEPFQMSKNSLMGPILGSITILFIFISAEFMLVPPKNKKAYAQKSLMRGIVKGLTSYLAILVCSFMLAQFYFKREENEIADEKLEIRRMIAGNLNRLQEENQRNANNNNNNPNNNPNDEASGFTYLLNVVSSMFLGNNGNDQNDTPSPTFREFINEQNYDESELTEEQVEKIREAVEQYEKKHESNIKYSLIADGGPRILFIFELVRIALLSQAYKNIQANILRRLENNRINLHNTGISKLVNTFLAARKRWNNLLGSLPDSAKTILQVLFYNALIGANPNI